MPKKTEEDVPKNPLKKKKSYREEFMNGFQQAAEYSALSKEQKEQVDAGYLQRIRLGRKGCR